MSEPDGRMHYFCAECWEKVPHGEELGAHGARSSETQKPLAPPVGKACCFCHDKEATHRARSHVRTTCPAGHLAPGRLDAIFERALEAHEADREKILAEVSPLFTIGVDEGAEDG